MTTEQLTSLAITAGILFAVFKFGPGYAKGAALGVAGVIVAKQIPYVQNNL
jgi:hypothetical protein